ncbi:TldD/PmbA family protein [Methylobacterium sp. sgz302541]|uniref:TldD/PmbA family protein n=1 Tax=unclassified Methylobacterium TaxID=2615210 RepID=UPI003D34E3EA
MDEVGPILSAQDCATVFGAAERAARGLGLRDVELRVCGRRAGHTRFAGNAIHQHVGDESRSATVRVVVEGRTACATTNRLDAESIGGAVGQALALARAAKAGPAVPELAGAEPVPPVHRYCPATAAAGPAERARAVAEAIRTVAAASRTAAGLYATEQSVEAVHNTRGVCVHHAQTTATFSVTATDTDSTGWAKAAATRAADLDLPALARAASEKARLSRSPRAVAPGAYTVVLEPAAVLDLLGLLFADFSGSAVADRRSFLTDRLGEPVFGETISIRDDAFHPLQSGPPFDAEGVPRRPLTLVEDGVPRELAYGRAGAARAGATPTGHGAPLLDPIGEGPVNIVIQGGATSIAEMIGATRRGILVTRLWYIRELDPSAKTATGMTRDGTFLIEDGEIACGLRNMRFNQSLIAMLRNVVALSPAVRASGEETFDMVVPAMQVADFRFTEVAPY